MAKKYGFIVLAFVFMLTMGCSSSPKRRSLGETLDDAVISNKLKAKYLSDKIINGFDINIDTWKGVVSLRGKADSQQQINRSIEVAELQQGVREVRSYLVLRQQEEEGLVKPKESFFRRNTPKKGEIEEKTIGAAPSKSAESKPQPVSKAKKTAANTPSAKPVPKEDKEDEPKEDKKADRNAAKEEPKPAIEEREITFRDSKKDVTRLDPSAPPKEATSKESAPKDVSPRDTSPKDTTHDSIMNEKPPRITDD